VEIPTPSPVTVFRSVPGEIRPRWMSMGLQPLWTDEHHGLSVAFDRVEGAEDFVKAYLGVSP